MRLARLPFAVMLPIMELAVWAILVPLPAAEIVYTLHRSARGGETATIQTKHYTSFIPRARFVPFAFNMVGARSHRIIQAFDMPGAVFDLLFSLAFSWPDRWHPRQITADAWQAICLPFFSLPFWWLAGKGLDGVRNRRRLNLAPLLIGSAMSTLCLVAFLGFTFGVSEKERGDDDWIRWSFALWFVVLAVLPLAWFRQRRYTSADDEIKEIF